MLRWKTDVPAAIAVFLVAVPLCLGIAHASNAPLLSGLVAGIIGGIVIGSLSRSSLSVSGPAAGLTAIVASAGIALGNFESLLTAIVLAGIFQMILGLLRMGTFGRYIPLAVIEGMLAAIGLTLILKQIPHLMGYDVEAEGIEQFSLVPEDFTNVLPPPAAPPQGNTLSVLWDAFHHFHVSIIILGVVSLLIMLFWDKIISKRSPNLYRMIPSSLVAIILGTSLALIYPFLNANWVIKTTQLVQLPFIHSWVDFVSQTVFPHWPALLNPKVYQSAFSIAFVASIESILCIEAIDKLDPQHRRTPINRELLAQGTGNFLSGLLGGLPITSVIVRSSVNLHAGAQSKLSAILHGWFLLLAILFAAPLMNNIPLAALSAVLILTGYKLAHPQLFMRLYKNGWDQFVPFLITILAILFSDLMIGVLIGIGVSAVFILHNHYKAKVVSVYNRGTMIEIVLGENLTFLNKQQIIDTLETLPNQTKVLINGSKTLYIDHDILEVLQDFSKNSYRKKIEVLIGGLPHMNHKQSHLTLEFEQSYQELINNNKEWVVEKELHEGARFFKDLAKGQSPQFLFVGCSDSRVPIEILTKAEPGDIFVHRNIANTVSLTDTNFLSVLEYAVKVLRVKHIVVCGHYECGGVKAALTGEVEGVIWNWISQIKDVYRLYESTLDAIADPDEKERRLIEYNVIEQVKKIRKTLTVQKTVETFGFPKLHGWVYDIKTGLIRELDINA
jgi:carbonic anhydrase